MPPLHDTTGHSQVSGGFHFCAIKRRAQTSGSLGFAGLPAGRICGLSTSERIVPLV